MQKKTGGDGMDTIDCGALDSFKRIKKNIC